MGGSVQFRGWEGVIGGVEISLNSRPVDRDRRPVDHKSDALTTTLPSHLKRRVRHTKELRRVMVLIDQAAMAYCTRPATLGLGVGPTPRVAGLVQYAIQWEVPCRCGEKASAARVSRPSEVGEAVL